MCGRMNLGKCPSLGWRSMSRATVVALLLVLPLAAWAEPTSPPTLTASDYSDEAKLADLLWNASPDVVEARTAAGIAASEVTRARTYPNPTLDFTWGTIPVGRTNPRGLDDPLSRVPNYT